MAYLTTLASVPVDDVEQLVCDPGHVLSPSCFEFVSHYLSYSVQVKPLRDVLDHAINGGDSIHQDLWHPLRPPIVHSPAGVCDLQLQLQVEWDAQFAERDIPSDDWYRIEIEKVLAVFGHAASRGECVVNVIHPPADAARASRVRMPVKAQEISDTNATKLRRKR